MINIPEIAQWCESNKYALKVKGRSPRLVIVGERHLDKGLMEKQEELIDLVKPGYILHELLENRTYDPGTKEITFVPGSRYGSDDLAYKDDINQELIDLADRRKIRIIGADLSLAEFNTVIEREGKRTKDMLDSQHHLVMPYREERMGQRMVEYLGKTTGDILAITGAYHISPKSKIHSVLRKNHTPYVTINQGRK